MAGKEKLTVFMAEDDHDIAKHIEEVLGDRFKVTVHRAVSAEGVKEFIKSGRLEECHIAFMDNRLEGERDDKSATGHRSIRDLLRAEPGLPVIAMSSSSASETLAMRNGAKTFVDKMDFSIRPQSVIEHAEAHRRKLK